MIETKCQQYLYQIATLYLAYCAAERSVRLYTVYTGWAKKFYPLRFSDNFSETAENF